jgi:sec-independent protein translocase protein TatA
MNLGMGEIALLLLLALVLFGAKRLPEVGRAAGDAIREFKSAMSGETGKGSEATPAKGDDSGENGSAGE